MSDTSSPVPPDTQPAEAPAPSVVAAVAGPSSPAERRLRHWPGVVIVALQWLVMFGVGVVAAGTMAQFFVAFLTPLVGAVALLGWWLFASRIRHAQRWLVLLGCVAAGAILYPCYDISFRDLGGMGVAFYVLPVLTTAWAGWLLVTPFLSWPVRRAGLLAVFLLAWGYFALVRFEGTDGSFRASLPFRWAATAEDKLLADLAGRKSRGEPSAAAPSDTQMVLQPGDWPGFRGPNRDGKRPGVRIATDWDQNPPRLLWRHLVGPGWSSFAVVGTRLYTQEQRGPDEVVVCYDGGSGSELWVQRNGGRFSERIGGPGPRATPTFHEGKLYAQGADGRLNCLDAVTGRLVWSRNLVTDSGATVPQWGFAASPLVAGGVVTVFAGAPGGKSVVGYNPASGEPVWSAGEGELSYCSTQLAHVGGIEQVLIATNAGVTSFEPAGGKVLWRHDWPLEGNMARVVQPAVVDESSVLIGTGMGVGTRRVRVSRGGEGWKTEEVWTTRAIRPYFNDLVIHGGHLYGFDNSFFTCVNLEDGKKKWRASGYGNGQVLLLPDQDLLLILSEQGEVALVQAYPEEHRELGRFQAIEGKTWNHPVVAHGKLFVRNSQEAACYQLTELPGGN